MLPDNGFHFTRPGNICSAVADGREAIDRGELFRAHAFESACASHHIDHHLIKPRHPWTNWQVERMNRTIKRQRSGASTTTATTSSAAISRSSSAPTSSAAG